MSREIWRKVIGLDIEASSEGRIRKISTGQIMSTSLHKPKNGYLRVSVTPEASSGKRKEYVHRLVCIAFYGSAPGMHVDHIDEDHLNNKASNLRWLTPEQNRARRTMKRGEDHANSKLSLALVAQIRSAPHYRGFDREWAEKIGVSRETIRDARNHKIWRNAE